MSYFFNTLPYLHSSLPSIFFSSIFLHISFFLLLFALCSSILRFTHCLCVPLSSPLFPSPPPPPNLCHRHVCVQSPSRLDASLHTGYRGQSRNASPHCQITSTRLITAVRNVMTLPQAPPPTSPSPSHPKIIRPKRGGVGLKRGWYKGPRRRDQPPVTDQDRQASKTQTNEGKKCN